MAWWRLNCKKVSMVDESLSQTRISYASRSALTQNASPFDAVHNRHLYGISTSSTTSRSTATKASSGAMANEMNAHRRHKRSRHRRKNHNTDSESSNGELSLASSHSSDDDERSTVPRQNLINQTIQQSIDSANVPTMVPHQLNGSYGELPAVEHVMPVSNSEHVDLSIGNNHYTIYGTVQKKAWTSLELNIDNGAAPTTVIQTADTSTGEPLYASTRPYNRQNILALGVESSELTSASTSEVNAIHIRTNPLEEHQQQDHQQTDEAEDSPSLSPLSDDDDDGGSQASQQL